jgi:hypothetical protein
MINLELSLLYKELKNENQEIQEWYFPKEITVLFFKSIVRDGFNDSYADWNSNFCRIKNPKGMKEKLHAFVNFSITCKQLYMVSHEINYNQFNGSVITSNGTDFLIIRSVPFRLCIHKLLNKIKEGLKQYKYGYIEKLYSIYTDHFYKNKTDTKNSNKNDMYHNRIKEIICECAYNYYDTKIGSHLMVLKATKTINLFANSLSEKLSIRNLKSAVNTIIDRLSEPLLERRQILFDLCQAIHVANKECFKQLELELNHSPKNIILSIQNELINSFTPEKLEIEEACKEALKELCEANVEIKNSPNNRTAAFCLRQSLAKIEKFAVFSKDFISNLDPQEKAEGFLSRHADALIGGRLFEIHKTLNNVYAIAEDEAKQLALLCSEMNKPVSEEDSEEDIEERMEALDDIVF